MAYTPPATKMTEYEIKDLIKKLIQFINENTDYIIKVYSPMTPGKSDPITVVITTDDRLVTSLSDTDPINQIIELSEIIAEHQWHKKE